MKAYSLAEMKAKVANEAEPAPEPETLEEVEPEPEPETLEEVEPEPEPETLEEVEPEPEPETLEADGLDGQELANFVAGKVKKKEKAKRERLQAKLDAQQSEANQLRAELATYKSGQPVPTQRPQEEDFDTQEEFDQAYSQYQLQLMASTQAQHAQRQAQQLAMAKRETAVEAHYDRAAEYLKRNPSVTESTYQTADGLFRRSLHSDPNTANAFADTLIERLGEGSEKVILAVGISEDKRNKLNTLLQNDPTGLSAMGYLAEMKSSLNSKPRSSGAQKPAPTVGRGSGAVKAPSEKSFKSAKSVQEAYQLRKEAKAAGVDTSSWKR